MEIIHQVLKNNGCFYTENKQIRVAEITYLRYGFNKMILDSSYVHPSLQKKQVLSIIIKKVVDFAIINNLQVITLCEDVKNILEENEDYAKLIFSPVQLTA